MRVLLFTATPRTVSISVQISRVVIITAAVAVVLTMLAMRSGDAMCFRHWRPRMGWCARA